MRITYYSVDYVGLDMCGVWSVGQEFLHRSGEELSSRQENDVHIHHVQPSDDDRVDH